MASNTERNKDVSAYTKHAETIGISDFDRFRTLWPFSIPIFSIGLTPFDCGDDTSNCAAGTRVIAMIIGGTTALTEITLAAYFLTLLFDSDPTKKEPWSKYHPRLDILLLILKVLLFCVVVLGEESQNTAKAVLGTLIPGLMFIMHNVFYPHYNIYMTQLVIASLRHQKSCKGYF
eukprot:jgi/Hompol1/3024/HPOL_006303-RA